MLGLWLHMLRFAAGLSAEDVEERTAKAVTESTVLRWERSEGDSFPDPSKLAILCLLYGQILGTDIQVTDLLDADFDTRVWFNGRTQASQA